MPVQMSSAPRFGNNQALHKHEPKVVSPRADWTGPPAPGHYDVGRKGDVKYPSPRASSFGGNLSKVDRSKTGLHGIAMKGRNLPGPNSYSVDASNQKLKTKSRAPTLKFGSSSRGECDGSTIAHESPALGPCGYCYRGARRARSSLSLRAACLLPAAVTCPTTPGSHRARPLPPARCRHRRSALHQQGAQEASLFLTLTTFTPARPSAS